MTPEEEAEILQLLRDKSLSIPEIVSRSGRSESVVQRIARENGIRRKTGHARKYSWEEIARLKAEGLGSEVIAERMGCSVNTVKHVLRRIGGGHDGGN